MTDEVQSLVEDCPRCGMGNFTPLDAKKPANWTIEEWGYHLREYPFPAKSRVVDRYICSDCGTHEAMLDFTGRAPIPPDEWPTETPTDPTDLEAA